eukprot:scaffold129628_cov21-Phaeocystis_antarctica.AAC.1
MGAKTDRRPYENLLRADSTHSVPRNGYGERTATPKPRHVRSTRATTHADNGGDEASLRGTAAHTPHGGHAVHSAKQAERRRGARKRDVRAARRGAGPPQPFPKQGRAATGDTRRGGRDVEMGESGNY